MVAVKIALRVDGCSRFEISSNGLVNAAALDDSPLQQQHNHSTVLPEDDGCSLLKRIEGLVD